MGRTMANAGFLKALLRKDPFEAYHFFLPNKEHFSFVTTSLEREGISEKVRQKVAFFTRPGLMRALSENRYYCFHHSDCFSFLPHMARLRNLMSRDIFPITGTTHSLSYWRYRQEFLSHVWPGATPREAIVATSPKGAEAVRQSFISVRRGYLQSSEKQDGPTVVEIPLGVDEEDLKPAGDAEKAKARQVFGLSPDRVVVLVFGRLSAQSKMDYLPLFRALQRLPQCKNRVSLLLAGWVDPKENIVGTLTNLAKNAGVHCLVAPRPSAKQKQALFAAADIFMSIADNPQETFGLTLLEAAAAGLPVIASDYDGYSSLVQHERTGLLIPTTGPRETTLADAMAPLCGDGFVHLMLAQETAVSVPDLAAALQSLIQNPALRVEMGNAGRWRVVQGFTWSSVVDRYLDLWEQLWKKPVIKQRLRKQRHPAHVTYASTFGRYPTTQISPRTVVQRSRTGEAVYRGQDYPVIHEGIEQLLDLSLLRVVLFQTRQPISVEALVTAMKPSKIRREQLDFYLLWALKHDLLEISE